MAESNDLWDAGRGCLLFLLALIALALIAFNIPVSLYFSGAVLGVLLFRRVAARLDAPDADFKIKVLKGAASDLKRFFAALAVGFGLVFALQIGLRMFGSGDWAQTVGTVEQRTWHGLVGLTAMGRLPSAFAIVAAAILLSLLLRTWLPLALAGRLRKAASTLAAVLAAVLLWSFVTEASSETNYESSTAGLRARLITTLDEVAKLRSEAAAYALVGAWVAEKRASEPLTAAALSDFVREAWNACDARNREVRARLAAGFEFNSFESGDLLGSQRCDEYDLPGQVARQLVLGPDGTFPDRPGMPWLPDARGEVRHTPPDEYPSPGKLLIEIVPKWRSLAAWPELLASAEGKKAQAEAARSQMRAVATKAVAAWMGDVLPMPAAVEKVVETLRDAALAVLAKEAEATGRARLELLTHGGGRWTGPSRRLLASLFPESYFAGGEAEKAEARTGAVAAAVAAASVVRNPWPPSERRSETSSSSSGSTTRRRGGRR